MSEEEILDSLIRREGTEFTNDPKDHGGPTKYGITLETLREERGAFVSAADVANLTEDEARRIYQDRYIRRPHFDQIADDRLRALLIDYGVNSGPKRAILALQRAVGASPDGIIGVETINALELADTSKVYAAVLADRIRHFVNIVLADASQLRFLRGWINRGLEFL